MPPPCFQGGVQMQTTEKELEVPMPLAPAEPVSESLHLTEEAADEIFRLAEAEIKPLLRKAAIARWTGRLQAAFCLCLILTGLIGTVYGVINYPKTTVTIFPVRRSVSMTVALNVPLRTLAPATLARSASIPTTGRGHQDARQATGIVTFYNGLFTTQTVPSGTVFTGSDGVKIATIQSVTIPAADPTANPPQFVGVAPVHAYAVQTGTAGNIPAYDINAQYSNGISVKNTSSFQNGRDARDFPAVAPQDIQHLTATLQQSLVHDMPQAFPLVPGEALALTHCLFTDTASHQAGEEASIVTLHASYACQGHAYNVQAAANLATAAFTVRTRPAPGYRLLSSVQTRVSGVAPLQVTVSGTWVYLFSASYEEYLAEHIAGDTPAQAKAWLLKTGVIAQAGIPASTLPQAMYIRFVVLVAM
jgi:hypothetical protein